MRPPLSIRQRLGTFVHDWPRFMWRVVLRSGVRRSAGGWVWMRNRQDRLSAASDGCGVRCEWTHTRTLHLCDVWPSAGVGLLRRALRDWPVLLSADVAVADPTSMPPGAPEVSFIVSHRGLERLPLLLQTLRSIAGQEGVPVECIVVEQDVEPFVQERLPEWVRYVFDRTDGPDVPYNRSRALNRGAAAAGGVLLVLHDSDIVIPAAYAAEVRRVLGEGYDIANLKRFIFCLARSRDMDGYMEADLTKGEGSVEAVVQNLCGGASLAVRRETFAALGGMDEGFEGWGGEDVEFWDRCQTRRVWNWSYLPMLHLWHPPQPGKTPSKDTPAMRRLESVLQIPGQERIRALRVSAAGRSFEPRLPEAQAVHGEVS